MKRQLSDRTETYDELIEGECSVCHTPTIKVVNSSISLWVTKERFHEPGDIQPIDIFRCKKCHQLIRQTFKPKEI